MRKGVKISADERLEKAKKACKCYLDGAKSWAEACKSVNISYQTLHNWAITNPKIKTLLSKTKDKANEEQKMGILMKASTALEKKLGCQKHSETHIEGFTDENGVFVVKKVVVKQKEVHPSDGIVQFVLKSLDPDNWQDKKEDKTEVLPQPTVDLSKLSDEQLGLLKELKQSMETEGE